VSLPPLAGREEELLALIPEGARRREPPWLPEVSQPELVRHFLRLARLNYGVDSGFYPLGSCTMKYNPKLNEQLARLAGFTGLHPLLPEEEVQGALAVLWELSQYLRGIAGMPGITLQPAAGAHGELTGMLLFKRYFQERGELERRVKILLPDSAHGTNPASAAMVGFRVVSIPSNERGTVDVAALEAALGEDVAGIMLTVPNTLGIFEEEILKITELVHGAGGLCYFDGANLNAYLGRARPGDMGADVFHFNLHKTFSTPHGGGGPGSGPIAVTKELAGFLPVPIIRKGEPYKFDYNLPESIGKIHSFYGNFLVMVKAYAYLRMLGGEGLRDVARASILNANYVIQTLQEDYKLPYKGFCMHEGVLSGGELRKFGVRALDVAKRLLDFGFHAPTIYFPLIVSEALMIEPTETEPLETLERFVMVMKRIRKEAEENPDVLRQAPTMTPVRRLDEVKAARELNVRFKP